MYKRKQTNFIVIHCSATPDDQEVTVDDIRDFHVKGRGWSDVGYHYVITRDGTTQPGRGINLQGAHVSGHNEESIGVCWVGTNYIGHEQWRSLLTLLVELCTLYGVPAQEIYGHRDFTDKKTCPNLTDEQMIRLRQEVRRRTSHDFIKG